MKFKTIIVEDELMSRTSLEKLCSKNAVIDLVSSFESGKPALEFIKNHEPDLVFLDIELPDLSGIDIIEELDQLPQIIFTTSKKEYAFEAIEFDVTDFLIKPIVSARFENAIERALKRAELLNKVVLASKASEFYLRTDGKLIRVPYEELLYFENVGDYIKVITERANYVFYGVLKNVDQDISHPRFLKVSRSFIVNLDKIIDIEDNSILIGKKVIPISRAFKPILMKSINILN